MRGFRKVLFQLLTVSFLSAIIILYSGRVLADDTGEYLFKENCSACHPDGGNILNPKKTLHRKDLETNGITTAEAIVKKMRNPGPVPAHPQDWAGMKMFDKDKISDEDALKIGEYILKTFR